MALVKTVDQRLPLDGAVNVSVNIVMRARFIAGYSGEGGVPDMDVTNGYASLSVDGNTTWDDLPVEGSSSSPPTCFTPTLTLLYDTEYTWTAYAEMYINQPGHGAPFTTTVTSSVFTFTTESAPNRQVILSSPANGATGLLLPPFLIEWSINGSGPRDPDPFEDQDFLFIYMRKDDANFTEDNLIGNFVQAYYNDNLQIVALTAPVYGSTYYWQVQGANTAGDLDDSEVWSFTMLDFLPPLYSTRYKLTYGEPGGPGDPEGDPGPQGGGSKGTPPPGGSPPGGNSPDAREYEVIPSGENNLLTVRRLIVAAKNKIFYEDV